MEITGNTAYQITSDSTDTTTSSEANNDLGKDAFLQLLVTQLRYQDPLSPMENEEFLSQMAQFTSVEQQQELNDSLSQMNNNTSKTGILNLMGTYVVAESVDEQGVVTSSAEGLVTEVDLSGGEPTVTVDGRTFTLDEITNVALPVVS